MYNDLYAKAPLLNFECQLKKRSTDTIIAFKFQKPSTVVQIKTSQIKNASIFNKNMQQFTNNQKFQRSGRREEYKRKNRTNFKESSFCKFCRKSIHSTDNCRRIKRFELFQKNN